MDNRENYWNNGYFEYFKDLISRTNEQESSAESARLATSDQNYRNAIELLGIIKDQPVLEMGSGFGRGIPLIYAYSKYVFSTDISEVMIDFAKKTYLPLCPEVQFKVCQAENTEFDSHFFQHIVCFAVFDALYQQKALEEMNRVLKVGGTLLVTGKNTFYLNADAEAFDAEVGARKKGHPNCFTNVPKLLSYLDALGFSLVSHRYYVKRGDFLKEKFQIEIPEKFYEYMLVLKKEKDIVIPIGELSLSEPFSETYKDITKG